MQMCEKIRGVSVFCSQHDQKQPPRIAGDSGAPCGRPLWKEMRLSLVIPAKVTSTSLHHLLSTESNRSDTPFCCSAVVAKECCTWSKAFQTRDDMWMSAFFTKTRATYNTLSHAGACAQMSVRENTRVRVFLFTHSVGYSGLLSTANETHCNKKERFEQKIL